MSTMSNWSYERFARTFAARRPIRVKRRFDPIRPIKLERKISKVEKKMKA